MHLDRLKDLLSKMELLVDNGNRTYQEDEELDELYHDTFRELDEMKHAVRGKEYSEFQKLLKKFKSLCNDFETPDDRTQIGWDVLFPNQEDYEGFDVDDFLGLD